MNAPLRQPIDEHDQNPRQHGGQAPRLEKYFEAMIRAKASDLHLKAGSPPHVRINSVISPTRAEPLTGEEIDSLAMELLTPKQRTFFEEHGSIDVAHELEGSDRFRLNIYRQRGHTSISVRRVTLEIPSFEALHLPPILSTIAEERDGLVLISGATGSGKSTTLAAMLEHLNRTRSCHIVTIEDPIEYIFQDKKALISQREIGIDVESFDSALKYLMREDPDVVLIGEMRDRETFQAAFQASETGHLVFGTVHASSAAQTVGRILDLFEAESRDLLRQSMAFNLRAIVCQKLVPSIAKGVGHVPAVEVLLTSPSVRQLLQESRESELGDAIRSHEREGMRSFTQSLLELIQSEQVDPKVAFDYAPSPEELKMLLKGISSSRSGLLGR
jgi:twitching motility protein PilT